MAAQFLYEGKQDSGVMGEADVAGRFIKLSFVKGKRYIVIADEKSVKVLCSGFFRTYRKGKPALCYTQVPVFKINCKKYLTLIQPIHETTTNSRPSRPAGSTPGAGNLNKYFGKMPADWK